MRRRTRIVHRALKSLLGQPFGMGMNQQLLPSERRRHPRFEVMAQVRVMRGRNVFVLDVINVSESGALVDLGSLERPYWLATGKRVELVLFAPDGDAGFTPVSIWAGVVRVIDDQRSIKFAVCFEDPQGEVAAAVRQLVEDSPPRPPPLPVRH